VPVEDFETWAVARTASLARTAFLLTADVQLAEDLLQETLVRVAQRWPHLRRKGTPDAWARRTMHHLAIDRWRRKKARPDELPTSIFPEAGGRDEAEQLVGRIVLRDALRRLTPRQRAMVSLRFYDDLTEAQTAHVLACSVSTVKSETRRTLQRLRELAPDAVASFEESR
jgi:RNA polymerase sigma-70 factor (sigma-E family)